jgi:ATP/maltotriose-dependent transcriptional regulator MalT
MLERQPADVQDLLLRTCVLDRVNGELADLLTGRSGSEQILLELEDANAFVVSLDPKRTWFRYHHLFADLLRLELRRTRPGQVPALHRQAADWFSGRGQIVDAIRHTQATGDWPEAARLLADHSFSLMLDGQAQTIQALVRVFPPGACGDNPELALVHVPAFGAGPDQRHLSGHPWRSTSSVALQPHGFIGRGPGSAQLAPRARETPGRGRRSTGSGAAPRVCR